MKDVTADSTIAAIVAIGKISDMKVWSESCTDSLVTFSKWL